MAETQNTCLVCEQSSAQVPLITIQYQGRDFYICPQHLPILIHKPAQLADRLPGAENLADTSPDHD
jgi:hypothetical protein